MLGRQLLVTGVLVFLLVTALAVIYCKYRSRQMFMAIQKQERQLDKFDVDWGRLQLEQTTLAGHNRVERLARKRLSMMMPQREKIIFLKP